MQEEQQHRAKPAGFSLAPGLLPILAIAVGVGFGGYETFLAVTGDESANLGFWWLFAWLLPVYAVGRFAIAVFERIVNGQTMLSPRLALMKQAQRVKPVAEIRVAAVIRWFNFALLVFALIVALAWWFLAAKSPQFAVERFMAIVLIAAPQAALWAYPLTSRLASALSAAREVYYSSRAQFDLLGAADMVVFDKTGTLTTAERRFSGAYLSHLSPLTTTDELLAIAAGVEQYAKHPIAHAIVQEASRRGIELADIRDFRQIPGQGLAGTLEAQTIVIGGPIILTSRNMTLYVGDLVKCDASNHAGRTVLFVIRDSELLGWLELGDQVRATSQHAVRMLQFQRKRIGLVTGDAQGVASSVAQELGITEIFAEVLPHQKADLISSLQADTSKVVVVGDAENDLPALQQADVSVAFGVESNEPLETVGLTVFGHDAAQFAQAVVISAQAAKVTRRSLTWSAIYTLVSLPLAAGAFDFIGFELSPAIAVALSLTMSAATLHGIRSLRKA